MVDNIKFLNRAYFLIFLLILCSYSVTYSQSIPQDRQVNWKNAGCKQSIHQPSTILNMMDFGADSDGLKSNDSVFSLVLEQLNKQPGVIYFPPGVYLFTSTVYLPANTVLRGYSSDSTCLIFELQDIGTQNCISVSGSRSRGEEYAVQQEPLISSGFLELNMPPTCNLGDYAEIYQENGVWDIKPASWAEDAVGQIVRIKSINGSNIELSDPLRITFSQILNPRIEIIDPVFGVGIEYLKIVRQSQSANPTGNNISFDLAVNCWVRGVESQKSAESHVMLNSCSNIEISGSYFHHSYGYDGAGTRGYGITLNTHSGECLIENNIFNYLRHSIVLKKGANGNVIGYNYSISPYRTELPHDAGGDICLHGHYAFSNLIEGNIVQNILIDHYWGPSGPLNSFFRNRAELYGLIMTNSTSATSFQNFVGNEITNTSMFFGNFVLTGSNHFSYANNVKGKTEPQGSAIIAEKSYYLTDKPLFWSIAGSWPSLGYPNKTNTGTIPAKSRYLKGKSMTVNQEINETELLPISNPFNLVVENIYPVPFSNELSFTIELIAEENLKIEILDINGKIVKSSSIRGQYGKNNYLISDELAFSEGMYLLKIISKNGFSSSLITKHK